MSRSAKVIALEPTRRILKPAKPRPRALAIPTYRPGEAQRCPSCSQRQWHVGRSTAQCAFCAMVLPIARDGRDA